MAILRGKRNTDEALRRKNLSKVRALQLYDTSVTDEGLKVLENAPVLSMLAFSSDFITDRGLTVIAQLPNITSIQIHGAPRITNASIPTLNSHPNLKELYLERTQIDDAGICALENLQDLWSVVLDHSPVSDVGLRHLATFKSISLLSACGTRVTGGGLSAFARHAQLDAYLNHCPIEDKALDASLSEMPLLRRLALEHTTVSCTGLKTLPVCTELEDLRLSFTRVTSDIFSILRRLPKLGTVYLKGLELDAHAISEWQSSLKRDITIYR